jgi:threonine dehydratase
MSLKTELAGALSVAALESLKAEIVGKTVVCVLSGGNLGSERYVREVKLV